MVLDVVVGVVGLYGLLRWLLGGYLVVDLLVLACLI